MTEDSRSALDALAGVHASENRLAERAGVCPPWRHALYGALFLVLIGSITISDKVQLVGSGIVILAAALMAYYDRRRRGLLITGFRRDKTLPVTLGFLGLLMVLVVSAVQMREASFAPLSKAGLAAIAFIMGTIFSVVRQRVYLRQLTDHSA
ncbi:hypothetical protein [Tsuneonella mangrovi]|uniref:hypothetical protein n=1 Tax=Tsuneonella mangrovi TaxID=1982042 RepID=UPI000BA269FB|nr:hypothetical protein [Tsuneonella mangrovi]